ncbi:amidohydrolase [Francisella halioticida]|uniref:Amidohydrolase n=1 Tax=Francisella halioticida TaxID=549298 RepID=A0ABN5AVH9_9GAMM|nr:M20 aminoacylase family protein [Francisella halioticida]ASG67894.1 amidohydrolase [Francisella halioticida]
MQKKYSLWRQDLHKYPEIGTDLHITSAKVAKLLKSFGLEVYENIGISGIVASLKNGTSNRSIALRADMDAIPIQEENAFIYKSKHNGAMHACGHDGHTTMLLVAAKELVKDPDFDGTVHFIFQPDEERGTGAQAMIDDGLFERFPADNVYGMHNIPGKPAGNFAIKSGSIMASESSFRIEIIGEGGHSSQPAASVDPIVIGSEIIMALQTIVSRNTDSREPTVVSVTNFETDGTTNVIASKAVITGDCRTFSESVQELIGKRIKEIANGICIAHNAKLKYNYSKDFYPTVNSEQATINAVKSAIATVGSDRVEPNCDALTVSEDFSSMTRVKPGAYIFIGNGTWGNHCKMLHNSQYDFNDEIIETGASYWINLVKQTLKSKEKE